VPTDGCVLSVAFSVILLVRENSARSLPPGVPISKGRIMQERGNRNREGVRFMRAERTLQEVADIMGLTKQRVQQIETLALKKLKLLLLEDEQFWRLLDDYEEVDVMGKGK